ncbi:MAG: protein phosphatase 2C domain-containing protein [Mycobacteriales bacterium]
MSDASADALTCPQCHEPVNPGDTFCESCGATIEVGAPAPEPVDAPATEQSARTHLIQPPGAEPEPAAPDPGAPHPAAAPAARPCAQCGGAVGDDGWCAQCGARADNGRRHTVEELSPGAAVVSDIGRLHARNEDAGGGAADGDWVALVVCDGVTSATDSDLASGAAVTAAVNVLVEARRTTGTADRPRGDGWADVLKEAALAADAAADSAATVEGELENPPSCTFVAAVADGARIIVSWVGDSRAYWLPDDGPSEQLSVDDSWASEQIAAGIAREVAEKGPQAHAITRWLGADSPGVDARVATTTADRPGWLLVCSDGLWNYASRADDLAALVRERPERQPVPLAEGLVAWANERGGDDNITVALARMPGAADSGAGGLGNDADGNGESARPDRGGPTGRTV